MPEIVKSATDMSEVEWRAARRSVRSGRFVATAPAEPTAPGERKSALEMTRQEYRDMRNRMRRGEKV